MLEKDKENMINELEENWTSQIELKGIEHVRARKNIGTGDSPNYIAWASAIRKYEKEQKKQADERYQEQAERENEALKIAKESNQIAESSNMLAKWAIFFSLIAIVVSAWVVVATR